MTQWIEDCARRALEMAGCIVLPGRSGRLLLFDSDGVVLATARRKVHDGKWSVRKSGGWLMFSRPPRLVADSPCFGFVSLFGLSVDRDGVTSESGRRTRRTEEDRIEHGYDDQREDRREQEPEHDRHRHRDKERIL